MGKVYALSGLIAAFLIAALAGQAHASVVYDLTLTATFDSDSTPLSTYNGTGTITLSSAPVVSGLSSYSSAAVTFLVDGESFSGNASSVQFLNGNFRNASFSQQIGNSPFRFDLQTTSLYVFYYDNEQQDASGTITSHLENSGSQSATPLPAALPLFASGFGGVGLLCWRRRKKAKALAS